MVSVVYFRISLFFAATTCTSNSYFHQPAVPSWFVGLSGFFPVTAILRLAREARANTPREHVRFVFRLTGDGGLCVSLPMPTPKVHPRSGAGAGSGITQPASKAFP